MKAVPIAPITLPLWWPQIEPWVRAAIEKSKAETSIDDVKQHLEDGGMQLWIAWGDKLHGCCITELIDNSRGRRCNLVIVAGDAFKAWQHLTEEIVQWARQKDCNRLTLEGRIGWERRLRDWRKTKVVMEKDI